MKNSSAEMPSVPSRLPSGMEPFNNPTYHHYRSAGTLFFNTQDNDLINYQQKQRRNHQNHSGSVPNIAEYSVGKTAGKTSENLQRRRSMSSHDIIDYSPPSRSNNGTTSRSHIYNTIGNFPNHHQPFPKLIQRHQSVREPMMSIVPEEGSLTPSDVPNQPNSKSPSPPKDIPVATPRKRTTDTLANIRTIGTISASSDQIHKIPPNNNPATYSLPRTYKKMTTFSPKINNLEQDVSNNEVTLTLKRMPSSQVQVVNPTNFNVYKSHDSGISSNGFYTSSRIMQSRGEGDGEEYAQMPKIYEKYPLEPPELPPRDYTTDEDNLQDEDDQNISDDDENVQVNSNRKFDKGGLNGLSTVYKIGSKPDLRSGSDYKVVDDFSTVQPEKPNLIFGKSESVIDDEEGVPMKQWLHGWQQNQNSKMDDKQSTLSRYWTMDRSLQRRLQKTNYQHIKRLCRDRGQLFEDPDFPPNNRSIYRNKKPALHPIVWLRPHEICQRPKFIAEGASRFDVEQGEQGDPWLLAAVSSLTLTPKFLDRVVPPDQNFEHGYCGVFRFRFWHFGDWVEVLIDDRLPTYKGRLVYLHSTDPSEFWAALLEKAYAKLYGTYEALQNGFTTKALQDLTGGIVQSFSLNSQDRLLTYQVLNSAVPRSTLLIASINIDSRHDNKRHLRLRNGLITRHAYSVTGLARVRGQLGDTHLVRLRNPWGKGEWNGPWSERSWEWDSLSDRDKELLSVRVRNEGEFWMAFDDFAKQFSHLDLVHIGPDDWMSEPSLQSKKPWRAVLARRRWRTGYNAGGSPSYIDTTSMNPQFHIQIPRSPSLSKCHVVVSVTQQYETNPGDNKKRKKRKLHHIGFAVYEVPPHMTRLTPLYVAEHQPLDVTNHSVAREVVTFFTLPPGDYIVVPQTNVPNCDGKFLLRILTDEQSNIWEVNEDNVLFRNVLLEFEEGFKFSENRVLLSKLIQKYPQEIDAAILQKILRGHWKAYLLEKPSLELCKSLVMLRDYNISGRLNLMEIPVLLHMLHFWRSAFLKYVPGSSGVRSSSFNLRLILWEAGITVSNKVLECLILRFAKSKLISSEAYVIVMIRLHLAHERYHSIDTKMKGNPLSLEEMILMTIYS